MWWGGGGGGGGGTIDIIAIMPNFNFVEAMPIWYYCTARPKLTSVPWLYKAIETNSKSTRTDFVAILEVSYDIS